MRHLDVSQAWRHTAQLVGGNRDMLAAIAGVFILLPNLAFAFFFPEPTIPPGLAPREQLALFSAAYSSATPLLLPITLLQMAGILIVIIVMTDRSRPTVGAAIRRGAVAAFSWFAAQLLIGMLLATALMAIALVSSALGNQAVGSALVLAFAAFAGTVMLRTVLVAPVIACEHQRNPVRALRRSWQLTYGSAWRLASFLLLAALLFIVVFGLIMLFVGVLLALTLNGEVQRVGAALVSSGLTAIAMVYAAGILAAVHDQLARPGDVGLASTFE